MVSLWGWTVSRLEPVRGGSLLFTTKFPEFIHPLKKVTPLFPSNPHFKTEILSSPSLFENLVGGLTLSHPAESEGCTLCLTLKFFVSRECQFHSLFHCVLFWLGITTDSKITSEFCEAIYQVPSKKYLSSPESPEEWKTISQ